MDDLKDFFVTNARISRRDMALFLDETRSTVNEVADDLDLPDRLTLEDAQALMLAIEEDDSADDDGADDEEE